MTSGEGDPDLQSSGIEIAALVVEFEPLSKLSSSGRRPRFLTNSSLFPLPSSLFTCAIVTLAILAHLSAGHVAGHLGS